MVVVLRQATAARQPPESPFHDPAVRLDGKGAVGRGVRTFDHRDLPAQELAEVLHQWASVCRIGGTMPEDLPTPAESISELERREQQRVLAERQPSLFGAPDERGSGED